MQDIVDTASASGSFKSLVKAVQAADLVNTLKGPGPFTVFAPTDGAFAQLPPPVFRDLLKPENKEKLQGILTYHVVQGRVTADDVLERKTIPTVQGQELRIDTSDGVTIEGAIFLQTDIPCSNGVIHVIDSILLPH
jgi:uncharacterized surface protein with fasciclin (FAS1) repeats